MHHFLTATVEHAASLRDDEQHLGPPSELPWAGSNPGAALHGNLIARGCVELDH